MQTKPRTLAHSRWLTCANRILRLYAATEVPSTNLKILSSFVIKVYAPTWFHIKMRPSCLEGPKHLQNMIHRSRFISRRYVAIIDPVIERNAYFAHPENTLLCMLNDKNANLRELALRRILKARSIYYSEGIREFKIPKINVEATTYDDLIDWQNYELSEPPILASIPNDHLNQLIKTVPEMDLVRFPSHTQVVERMVKVVSEASLVVSGAESIDGYVMAKLHSRSEMPVFETKKEFK
nr:unnamed protein product [Callosobruchus analis]